MTTKTDTDRVVQFLRDHPGSSVMDIRFGTYISGVTQRMSDARREGYEFAKWRDDNGVWRYRVREPGPIAIDWDQAS